jgi:hypothetical protein
MAGNTFSNGRRLWWVRSPKLQVYCSCQTNLRYVAVVEQKIGDCRYREEEKRGNAEKERA